MKPISAFVVLLGFAAPQAVSAQLDGPYQMAPGDTLRFTESTFSTVHIQTPQGDIRATSSHDASIAIAMGADGSIDGWYESLALASDGPNGMQRPTTTSVVGAPFRLTVSPTGKISTESAPTPSEEIQAITDLTQQFLDFFITLPSERPSVGSAWADTLISNESGITETSQVHQAIRSYRVVGDTIVDGVTALVIATQTTVEVESTSPMEGQPVTVTTTLSGSEAGTVVFDWAAGRLLSRDREGELTGVFRINAPQPIQFPQSMTYSARMTG